MNLKQFVVMSVDGHLQEIALIILVCDMLTVGLI
jgi:hypothetical protein